MPPTIEEQFRALETIEQFCAWVERRNKDVHGHSNKLYRGRIEGELAVVGMLRAWQKLRKPEVPDVG